MGRGGEPTVPLARARWGDESAWLQSNQYSGGPCANLRRVAGFLSSPRAIATPLTMSVRSLCTALVLVLACSGVARADELKDIEALYHDGKVEQALQRADAAIAAQPRAAQIRFLKGVMLTDLGRKPEAIEVYVSLTQDFPELADPYNNLAVLYASSGQLQDALTALQSALRNDPHHLRARENLGDVYMALAVQAWEAAEVQSKGEDAKLLRKLKKVDAVVPKSVTENPARRQR